MGNRVNLGNSRRPSAARSSFPLPLGGRFSARDLLESLEGRVLLSSTYYVAPGGSDAAGAGSSASPWATFARAYQAMRPGDTLVAKDGTYNKAAVLTDAVRPPSGSAAAGYTTVRAQTPGKVVVDQQGTDTGISVNGGQSSPVRYVAVDGIVFRRQGAGARLYAVDHVKVTRSGFEDAADGNNHTFAVNRYSSDVLVEDCFAWGGGRYKFSTYHADRVVFRRNVARFDRADAGGEPIAAFAIYASNDVEVQNCISVDGDQSQYWTNVGEYSGNYSIPSTDGPSTNVNIVGSIALNTDMQLLTLTKDLDNVKVTDTVGWHLRDGVWARDSAAFDHITLGDLYGPGRGVANVGMQYSPGPDPVNANSIRNSVLTNIKGTALTGWAAEDYNVFWGNARDRSGTPTGSRSVAADPKLRYILRAEPTSAALYGRASDGRNIGATVTKRVGVTGTMWGEAGYDQVTGEDLWPFPNEDVIGTFMRSYQYGALSGDRGFARAGETLTNYVWNYLGNGNPYAGGGGGSTPAAPPAAPSDVRATAAGASRVDLTWSDNSADETGFVVERQANGGAWARVAQLAAGVTAYADTSVAAGTAYAYRLCAVNGAAASTYSNTASATTAAVPPADATAPAISGVGSSAVGPYSATVAWATDEASDTQVEYGTTTAYGSSTTLNTTKVTAHAATLGGLTPGTVYHFRVKSRDAAGNLATSGDFTLTTAAAPAAGGPVASWSFDEAGGTTAADGTGNGNAGALLNGAAFAAGRGGAAGNAVAFDGVDDKVRVARTPALEPAGAVSVAAWVYLAGTQANWATIVKKTYADDNAAPYGSYSLQLSPDGLGNILTFQTGHASGDHQLFSPSPLPTGQWIHVAGTYDPATGQKRLYVDGTLVASKTLSSAIVYDTTSSGDLYIGQDPGAGEAFKGKIDEVAIWSRALTASEVFALATPSDTTAPVISGVSVSNVTSSGITINWSTDEAADTQVAFGTTAAYGSTSSLNSTEVTSHTVTLTGLLPSTTYHYVVRSRDAAGNLTVSGDFTFTTAAAPDVTAPVITGVNTSGVGTSTATVKWNTNEASDTQVEYGTTTAYGGSTTLNTTKVTAHTANLTGLVPGTVYHYRVKSRDAAGNLRVSGDFTFTTAEVAQPGQLAFSAATYTVEEGGGSVTITVIRTGGSAAAVSVVYAITGGTATAGDDYTSVGGTLSFAAGETEKTFTIPVADDSLTEDDESLTIALSNPGGGATLGAQSNAVVTIQNDDVPPEPGENGLANAIAYDGAGVMTMVYFDDATKNLKYVTRSAAGAWSAVQTVDAGPNAGAFLSLALDSTGRPGIAYLDGYNADLKYASFDGSNWNIQTVDAKKTTGYYPSLQFGAGDRPVISYYYKSGGDLRVAASGPAGWTISTVESRDDVGRYSALAANPLTGRWSVAYEDTTHGTFRYADQTRNGWNPMLVDGATISGGGYISLAFHPQSQRPAMSYYDAYNADLKFASFDGSKWSTDVVAARGTVGLYSNLRIRPDTGLAEILYYSKGANGIFRATAGPNGWSLAQVGAGGGRWLSTAVAPNGTWTSAWLGTSGIELGTL